MEMIFRKLPEGRHDLEVRGRRGPDVRLTDQSTGPAMPHDLVHAAVERARDHGRILGRHGGGCHVRRVRAGRADPPPPVGAEGAATQGRCGHAGRTRRQLGLPRLVRTAHGGPGAGPEPSRRPADRAGLGRARPRGGALVPGGGGRDAALALVTRAGARSGLRAGATNCRTPARTRSRAAASGPPPGPSPAPPRRVPPVGP